MERRGTKHISHKKVRRIRKIALVAAGLLFSFVALVVAAKQGVPKASGSEAALGDAGMITDITYDEGYREEATDSSYEGKVDSDLIRQAEESKDISSSSVLRYQDDNGFGYLNNCVILGDSRIVGMVNYGFFADKDALAKVGVSHMEVEKTVFSQNSGAQYTLQQFLQGHAKDVVYVCYGVNGIYGTNEDKYKETYESLVDHIISWAPKSNIVLMAIWPVDDNGMYAGRVKNEWIDKYNEFLLDMAERKGIYYLDIDTILKDGNGSINPAYDGGDGLHYRASAYKVILEYIVSHPVPGISHDGDYKVPYVKPSSDYTRIVKKTAPADGAAEKSSTAPTAAELAALEAASKEAASKEAASREAASLEAASKEAASKEAASREAASKEASREAASREAARKASEEAAREASIEASREAERAAEEERRRLEEEERRRQEEAERQRQEEEERRRQEEERKASEASEQPSEEPSEPPPEPDPSEGEGETGGE